MPLSKTYSKNWRNFLQNQLFALRTLRIYNFFRWALGKWDNSYFYKKIFIFARDFTFELFFLRTLVTDFDTRIWE